MFYDSLDSKTDHVIIHYDNHQNLSPSIHMPTDILYSMVMYMSIHCDNHFF